MIIEKTTKNIISSGNIQSASCTIDASDMRYIASLLRNNYSDTKLATIREIIANALDVSNGRMVEVQLPTKLEQNFIVRDFGCGLSEDDMMGLYTKYGKSTKRDSNNAIGGFGIGRFAPLSYTESFIVMSVFEGRKTAYSIRVDENDDTVVSKMFSQDSSEENGIFVQVPIKDQDINEFNRIFSDFSVYLSDKILLTNDEFNHPLPTFSNDTFDYYEAHWDHGNRHVLSSKPHVLMGGILYPIVESPKYKHLACGVVYKAKIGEFKLHHSREALEYNDKTINALIEASNKVAESFAADANKRIASCSNLLEAYIEYRKFTKCVGSGIRADNSRLSVEFKGFSVSQAFNYSDLHEVRRITRLPNGNLRNTRLDSWSFQGGSLFDENCFCVVDDDVVDVKAIKNRLSWIEEGQIVHLLTTKALTYDKILKRVKAMDSKRVSLLSEHERTIAPRTKTAGNAVKKGDILELGNHCGYRNADCWKSVSEELSDNDTHYYVVYNANKVEVDGELINPQTYISFIKSLKTINPKLDRVYGIRKNGLSKIKKKSNWVALDSVQSDWIENSEVVKATTLHFKLAGIVRSIKQTPFLEEALSEAADNEIILNLKKSLNASKKAYEKARSDLDHEFIKLVKVDVSEHEENVKAFYERYPLVQYIERAYGFDKANVTPAIKDYLQR